MAASLARPNRSSLAVLSAIGFVLLIGLGAWIFSREQDLEEQQAQQTAQLQALQQRPVPQPVDLSPLQTRIAALEKQVQALGQQQQQIQQPVEQRIAAAMNPVNGRLDQIAADQKNSDAAIADLEKRVGDVAQQLGADADAAKQASAAAAAATDAAHQATAQAAQSVAAAQAAAAQSATAAQQAARALASAGRADTVQQALAALYAGRPLGTIPGAPPALQQFATIAPPTEADLRLSYPAAAQAAAVASKPPTDKLSLGDRMLENVKSMVTIRQGDKVLVGSPAITILDAARGRLDAGDLAGAVAELDQLDGAAAQAMAPWLTKAKSLLAARTALFQMAHA